MQLKDGFCAAIHVGILYLNVSDEQKCIPATSKKRTFRNPAE
jgi:hypothetical protein